MALPPGITFEVIANPGVDGNRIVVELLYVYGAGTVSVTLTDSDYNTHLISATIGFGGSGTNVDWDTIASAVNAAAGSIVTAQGVVSDTSILTPSEAGLMGGGAGNSEGQYYSAGVSVVYNYASAGGSLATQGNYASA